MQRPKIKIELSQIDKLSELFTFTIVVLLWVYIFIHYSNLPEIIPIHFNASGKADGWGSKLTLFILPTIATILTIGFKLLAKIPHHFNYLIEITQENATRQYTIALKGLIYLNLAINLTFAFIVYQTISAVNYEEVELGTWFIAVFIILISLPVLYIVINGLKEK